MVSGYSSLLHYTPTGIQVLHTMTWLPVQLAEHQSSDLWLTSLQCDHDGRSVLVTVPVRWLKRNLAHLITGFTLWRKLPIMDFLQTKRTYQVSCEAVVCQVTVVVRQLSKYRCCYYTWIWIPWHLKRAKRLFHVLRSRKRVPSSVFLWCFWTV